MSEQPQGPGWWQASDGKFYPPESAQGQPQPNQGPQPTDATAAGTTITEEPPKKSIFKRWWFWVLVALGLIIIIGLLGGGGEDADDTAATATPTTEATPTEEPTPIETEEPTPTPTPTEEPEPTPEPEPPAEPVTYEGSGDTVLAIEKPADVVTASFTHQGSSNFAVENLDADLNRIGLLVNTIGAYEGTVLMDATVGEQTSSLQITADGAWTVTLADVAAATRFADETSGTGDSVVIFDGSAGVADVSHQGESNFAIEYFAGSDRDLLVNEIGNYSGQVPFRSPPAVVAITADGAWTIRVG